MADEPLPTNNPYEAPTADIAGPAPPPVDVLTRDEVDAFVGKRAAHFWSKWRPVMASGSWTAGFSWAAGFFNFLWFLYRKMYREFAICLLGETVLGYLVGLVAGRDVDRVFNAVGFAIVGTLGNGLYLRRARIAVAAARQAEPDLERRLALLRKKGGTSILWPLLTAAALFSLTMLSQR
jgi:Protein of unknown function (DUF2628)